LVSSNTPEPQAGPTPVVMALIGLGVIFAYLVVGSALIILTEDDDAAGDVADYFNELEEEELDDFYIINDYDTNKPLDEVIGELDIPGTVDEEGNGIEYYDPQIPVYDEEETTIPDDQIDWNNNDDTIPETPDRGDPLVFTFTGEPQVQRAWPEWHESRLTEFDLYDIGENVTLSRSISDGTMSLFLDLNGDGELSNGTEWLYDQNENGYEILSRPLIDSNQNGWFDYSDELWSIAMIKQGDNHYFTATELGIVAINWDNHSKGHGDMFGENRQYSNCLYEGEYYYPECVAVAENQFAIMAYNQNSILLNNGKVLDSFGSVMGHLDMDP